MLKADGFDDCIIGVTAPQPSREECLVYDFDKCVSLLMERDGMTEEDAVEYMLFNVTGAYVGDDTPIFMYTAPDYVLTRVDEEEDHG